MGQGTAPREGRPRGSLQGLRPLEEEGSGEFAESHRKRGAIMKKSYLAVLVLSVGLGVLAGPGCAINDLKNTNRRLKEANDHLVAENNRLEQELAASEKDLADKNKTIGDLQAVPAVTKAAPAPEPVQPVARSR